MMKFLNNKKRYLAVMAAGSLGLIVSWSSTDAITWDTEWVKMAVALIGMFGGVAIVHGQIKNTEAKKGS